MFRIFRFRRCRNLNIKKKIYWHEIFMGYQCKLFEDKFIGELNFCLYETEKGRRKKCGYYNETF